MSDPSNYDFQAPPAQTAIPTPPPPPAPPKRVPNAILNKLGHIAISFGAGYGAIEVYRQNPTEKFHWFIAAFAVFALWGVLQATIPNPVLKKK